MFARPPRPMPVAEARGSCQRVRLERFGILMSVKSPAIPGRPGLSCPWINGVHATYPKAICCVPIASRTVSNPRPGAAVRSWLSSIPNQWLGV